MMNFSGVKKKTCTNQTALPICLSILEIIAVLIAKVSGPVYSIRMIIIGETHRKKMYQPLAYRVMDRFLNVGFELKEDVIKRQFNCKATGFWVEKSKQSNFLLIMHEHLFVFQKI